MRIETNILAAFLLMCQIEYERKYPFFSSEDFFNFCLNRVEALPIETTKEERKKMAFHLALFLLDEENEFSKFLNI